MDPEPDTGELVARIGVAVNSELDLKRIFERVAEAVRLVVEVDRFAISSQGPDGTFVMEHVSGVEVEGHSVGANLGPLAAQVAATLSDGAVVIPDLTKTASTRLTTAGLRSALLTPVGDPANPIAVLGAFSLKTAAYNDRDARVMTQVAEAVAPAIGNARLYRESQRVGEERAALAEIGRSAAEAADMTSLYSVVHGQLTRLVPFDRFVIGLWEADGTIRQAFVRGVEVEGLGEGTTIPIVPGMFTASTFENIQAEERHPGISETNRAVAAAGLKSLAQVPIHTANNRVGVLSVRSKEPERYGARHLKLLEQVSAQLAPVIKNFQLIEIARREATERAAIAKIGVIANSQLELAQIFEHVSQEIAGLLHYDRLTFATLRPDGKLEINHVSGLPLPGYERGTVHTAPDLKSTRTSGGKSRAADGAESALMERAVEATSLRAWLQVPLGELPEPIGYLSLRSTRPDAYRERDTELLKMVAAQVTPAIKNARLYARTAGLASEARLLADISRAATAGLDIPALAQRFLAMARDRIPFDRATLRMVDATTGGLGSGAAVGSGAELPLPAFRSRSVTEAVALGRMVIDVDAEPEEPSSEAPLAKLGLRSSVTLPLISDEHVVGVVTLRRTKPDGFGHEELDFLSRACAQIAPAVDNARLLSEISTLASSVENSPDFICSADLDSRIQYVNAAGRTMIGLASDYDVTQLDWGAFFSPDDVRTITLSAIPASLSRGSWHGELTLVTREDSTIPTESLVVPVYHRNGALIGVTVSARNIADRKRSEAELNRLATTDTLTGLLNRRQFMIMLEHSMQLARRRRTQSTLVYLDLDGFKYVNDTHGHTAGDHLLIAVAKTLRSVVRTSDVVARTGGDEFVVILNDAPAQEGLQKAYRLVQRIAETVTMVGADRVNTSCSAGVVTFPVDGASAEDLVAFADLAMYRAKDAGRNRAYAYDPAEGGRELVSGLQRTRRMILEALSENRLKLFRQPIFDVQSRQPYMYEVLVRAADENGRLYGPSEFIPQAETLDLIHLIDQRVVDMAFERWRAYTDRGDDLRLAVNLSARSLDQDMAKYISAAGERWKVDPGRIAIEITETATWRGGLQTEEFARTLSGAGFRLSIDDFGSGATSFKQIRSLPFHYLKLDGSLVENLKDGRPDRDFVRSLSGLAHTLNVEIIAEFVQDEETMAFLKACGVEYAQGYFLGRPAEFPLSD